MAGLNGGAPDGAAGDAQALTTAAAERQSFNEEAAAVASDESGQQDDGGQPQRPVQRAAVERPEREPDPLTLTDEARDEIAAKYRAKRDGRILDGDPKEDAVVGPDPDRAPPMRQAPAEQPQEPLFEMIVDGRRVVKTQSEVLALAQRDLAADNRLAKANDLLDRVKNRVAEFDGDTSRQPAAARSPAQAAPDRQTTMDPARLKKLAEQIQYGDPDDAARALASFAEEVRSNAPDVRAQVEDVIVSQAVSKEFREAIGRVAYENREVIAVPGLEMGFIMETAQEVLRDFEKLGCDPAQIEAIRNNPAAIRDNYLKLRREGWKGLRSPGDIANAAIGTISRQVNYLRGGAPVPMADRSARKDALAPQPRPARAPQQVQRAPAPESGNRFSRGFNAVAASRIHQNPGRA